MDIAIKGRCVKPGCLRAWTGGDGAAINGVVVTIHGNIDRAPSVEEWNGGKQSVGEHGAVRLSPPPAGWIGSEHFGKSVDRRGECTCDERLARRYGLIWTGMRAPAFRLRQCPQEHPRVFQKGEDHRIVPDMALRRYRSRQALDPGVINQGLGTVTIHAAIPRCELSARRFGNRVEAGFCKQRQEMR